jgi:hypothetical protein
MFDGLGRMWLRAPGNVARAITVECPVCHEKPGTACRVIDGTNRKGEPAKIAEVHDQRESVGYRAPRLSA